MKFYDAIVAGLNHLQQNRMRAGLSILGIFIGVASVLCMMTVGDGVKKIIVDNVKRIGGENHVRFATRYSYYQRGRIWSPSERYTVSDALAIEASCPSVTAVLPRNLAINVFATYNNLV